MLGTVFAVIIAKQLYGGLGQNPFNPAMIGYGLTDLLPRADDQLVTAT